MSDQEARSMVRFHRNLSELKGLVRRGWAARSVGNPESVAEHSFGVALLAAVWAGRLGLDPAATVTCALLHDLCEAISGDVIPADKVPAEAKHAREKEAMEKTLSDLPEKGPWMDLWLDQALGRTPEGRLVQQLDKLEMILTADLYEERTGIDLDEFFASGRKVDLPELRAVVDLVERNHRERKATNIHR